MERRSRARSVLERINRGGSKNPKLMRILTVAGGVDIGIGFSTAVTQNAKVGGAVMAVGVTVYIGGLVDSYFRGRN